MVRAAAEQYDAVEVTAAIESVWEYVRRQFGGLQYRTVACRHSPYQRRQDELNRIVPWSYD